MDCGNAGVAMTYIPGEGKVLTVLLLTCEAPGGLLIRHWVLLVGIPDNVTVFSPHCAVGGWRCLMYIMPPNEESVSGADYAG